MENNVKVNTNSLREVSNEIDCHTKIILDYLNEIANDFSNLDECFDSKTAKVYKEEMNKCLSKTIEHITSKNEFLINKLNDINKTYCDFYYDVKTSVNGNNMVNNNE